MTWRTLIFPKLPWFPIIFCTLAPATKARKEWVVWPPHWTHGHTKKELLKLDQGFGPQPAHTLTDGFSEMKVSRACLTSSGSLVVLKSLRALPAVVYSEWGRTFICLLHTKTHWLVERAVHSPLANKYHLSPTIGCSFTIQNCAGCVWRWLLLHLK